MVLTVTDKPFLVAELIEGNIGRVVECKTWNFALRQAVVSFQELTNDKIDKEEAIERLETNFGLYSEDGLSVQIVQAE